MGLGSFWDPNEHPRGWHGRFAKKWKISDALRGILDSFRPRTFQSDSQAGQYAFNQGHKNGPFSSVELTRLRKDWDEAQDHLRAKDMDPQTKAFDDMMQSHMRPTTEGLIATKTFGPDALGLRPDQMRDGPGGITDMFGTVLGDGGYSAVHLGNDVSAGQHGPGKITMTILVPPGTKAAFPGQSPQDRGFFLDKEQPLLITRVDPDGMGGWRMAAVAEPHPGTGSSPVREELNPGRKGVGLTPEERAARLAEPNVATPAPAAPPAAPATEAVMRPESVQAPAVGRTPEQEAARVQRAQVGRQANVNEGNAPVQAPLPTPAPRPAPAPAPAAGPPSPTGVPERNEPIHSPSIGGTGTEGKSASEIANKPPEPAPEPPPTLSPSEQGKTLKDAYMESGIESPAAGPHRAAFNRAYLKAKSPTGHPEQALRDLEKDIKGVEQKAAEQKVNPSDRPDMATAEADAKSMNDLADLIATHFGLPRTQKEEKAPESPIKRTGEPDEFLGEKKPGAREAAGVSGQPSRTQTGLTEHEQAGSGPGTAGVGGRKEGAPETPAPRGSSGTTKEAEKPTVSAARVKAGDVVLARKDENGDWVHTSRKTGATPITVTGKGSGNGAHIIEGTDPDGNKVRLQPIRGQNVLTRHQEKAPKAPASKKAVKEAEPGLTDREQRAARRRAEKPAELSDAQKADITEKAARADARQKAAQEAPLSKKQQESMPKFMRTGEDTTGIQKMAKDSDIPGDGGGLVTDAEARLKEGQSPDEVGKWLDQQATKLSDDAAKEHTLEESDDLETKSRKRAMVQEANNNADKLRELADRVRGKGAEGTPASPSLEERQTADTAGVDRVLKAYNDILAKRPDDHDRRVSIADLRQELGHDLSRAELTRALREIGRGGSGHGGLLSRGVKPDARTEANGMDMGGEKVHFLQLPRPGEKERGKETIPHPKEEPTPEVPKKRERFSEAAAEKQFNPQAAGPNPEAVAAAKKAYEDIVARRGPDGDRKVSLQDIRQELELNHSFSRPEVDKALKELGRGGSEHGGLISGTNKPSTREAAGAMKMGGEDVHFLQLPRPGEAGRGGETTPNAPEVSTPEAPAAEARDLDKMTKADLLAHPDATGAKKSWTKDKIKQHILANQGGAGAPVPHPLDNPSEKPSVEDRIATKLLERMKPEMRDRILADMTPEERKAVEEAQRKVTDLHPPTPPHEAAKVLGRKAPRPSTPIDNEPRANEFTKAWDAAGIPEAPGSAGRSMKEIRKDLAEGKIDPAEGVRRMESEVSFNKQELAEVESDLRAPGLSDGERAKLQEEHAKISEGIKAQEKASEFLRAHFGGEGDAPTVAEVKAELPADSGRWIDKATPEDMQEAARIQGLKEPKGATAEEMFDDLIKQTIENELDKRKAAKTEQAAKAEAARIKKEAREAGKAEFRPGGAKHLDAAKIAEGIDGLDPRMVDRAQVDLNDGQTPGQVARGLRAQAGAHETIHSLAPEDRANRQEELDQRKAVADRMRELADRIEASKRPRKPRAPSTKLTPTDHAAAREAAKATGTPVAEVRSAIQDAKEADAKLQELGIPTSADELHARTIARSSKPFNDAKTAEEARQAATRMHAELTLAEIRKMGAEHGITGRSKKDITDKIIARRFPDEPATVREAGPPTGFAIPPKPTTEEGRLTGGDFHELKAGDPIDVHLGGSKTRKDSVAKVDPDGTLHTKGGYKYGPTSDVQISRGGAADTRLSAPARKAQVERARKTADVVAEVHELVGNGASPDAIRHRLQVSGQANGIDTAELQSLADDPKALTEAADKLGASAGLHRVGDVGSTTLFSRANHEGPGGRDVGNGENVRITRPGHTARLSNGEDVTISRPKVHPVVAEPAKVAKKAVPAKKVAKPGPAAEPRLSPEAEKARLEQERADNMARLAAAKAVKKAAPAKATPAKKATKAAPGEARIEAGKFSDKPFREQTWGGRALPNDLRYHESGEIGSALDMMGQDQRLDVGGEPLRNVLGQIATDVNRGSITPAQGLERYKALAARLPAGSKAKETLDRAIKRIDSPPRKPNLPEGTPPHIRKLAERLAEIPIARQPEVGHTGRKGELEQVEELARELTNGEPKSIFTAHAMLEKLVDNRHESASDAGYNQIITAIREALKEDDAARAAARKAKQKE